MCMKIRYVSVSDMRQCWCCVNTQLHQPHRGLLTHKHCKKCLKRKNWQQANQRTHDEIEGNAWERDWKGKCQKNLVVLIAGRTCKWGIRWRRKHTEGLSGQDFKQLAPLSHAHTSYWMGKMHYTLPENEHPELNKTLWGVFFVHNFQFLIVWVNCQNTHGSSITF